MKPKQIQHDGYLERLCPLRNEAGALSGGGFAVWRDAGIAEKTAGIPPFAPLKALISGPWPNGVKVLDSCTDD
jgi:hypothetical protein